MVYNIKVEILPLSNSSIGQGQQYCSILSPSHRTHLVLFLEGRGDDILINRKVITVGGVKKYKISESFVSCVAIALLLARPCYVIKSLCPVTAVIIPAQGKY